MGNGQSSEPTSRPPARPERRARRRVAAALQAAAKVYRSPGLLWGIALAGVLSRAVPYVFNRALWHDECKLAVNIVGRSFSGLLGKLDYHQVAPAGFLFITKLSVLTFGNNEYALRLVPLVLGIAAIFLFWAVARRCVRPNALPIALCLFALSHRVVYFSAEVKQYSGDVFFVVLLYWLVFEGQSRRLSGRWLAALALVGAVSIWFSHPAAFVLAGAGSVLGVSSLSERNWRKTGRLAVVGLVWGLSFAAFYLVSIGAMARYEGLVQSWQESFMPLPPLSVSGLKWLADRPQEVFRNVLQLNPWYLGAFAYTAGCASIFLRDKRKAFVLVLPVFFALLASGLQKYPFESRPLLFLAPSVLLLMAEGAEYVRSRRSRAFGVMGVILIGTLLCPVLLRAARDCVSPRTRQEIRPVLQHVRERYQTGDVLYLYCGAKAAFDYYSPRYGLGGVNAVRGVLAPDDWSRYRRDLEGLVGNRRVWIVFSHIRRMPRGDEEELLLGYLDEMGDSVSTFRSPGASVHLYDLQQRPPPAGDPP